MLCFFFFDSNEVTFMRYILKTQTLRAGKPTFHMRGHSRTHNLSLPLVTIHYFMHKSCECIIIVKTKKKVRNSLSTPKFPGSRIHRNGESIQRCSQAAWVTVTTSIARTLGPCACIAGVLRTLWVLSTEIPGDVGDSLVVALVF